MKMIYRKLPKQRHYLSAVTEPVIGELDLCDQIGSNDENRDLGLIDGEFNSILAAQLGFLLSLDHFIRSIQQRLRNGETDLLRCFQIDHQLKLRGLLDGKCSRLGSLQDSVHVICNAPVALRGVCLIGHESANVYISSGAVNRR